jgi:glyoxylate carboligase
MSKALEKTGVKRVYGVVGDSLNGFTDALRRKESIDWIHMRHEEAAAFAVFDTAGCPTLRRRAAAENDPVSTTRTKASIAASRSIIVLHGKLVALAWLPRKSRHAFVP